MSEKYENLKDYKIVRKEARRKIKSNLHRNASTYQRREIQKRIEKDIESIKAITEILDKIDGQKSEENQNFVTNAIEKAKNLCDTMKLELEDKSTNKKKDYSNVKMGKSIDKIHEKVERSVENAREIVSEFKKKLNEFIENGGKTVKEIENEKGKKTLTSIPFYKLAFKGEEDIDYNNLKETLLKLDTYVGKLETFLERLKSTSSLFNIEETIREMRESLDEIIIQGGVILNENDIDDVLKELLDIRNEYEDTKTTTTQLKKDGIKRQDEQYKIEKIHGHLKKLWKSYSDDVNKFNNLRIVDSNLEYYSRRGIKCFFECVRKIRSFLQFIGVIKGEMATAQEALKTLGKLDAEE